MELENNYTGGFKMRGYFLSQYYRLPQIIIHKNQRAEELICELLKNLTRYNVVMLDLQHRDKSALQNIFNAFPFLNRDKIPKSILDLSAESDAECVKLAYTDFVKAICESDYYKKYPSIKILQEIICCGFPVADLYEILDAPTRETLCKLLPGIKLFEAERLEAKGPDKFRDVIDYKIMHTPVVYQGMQYDFARVMKYILTSKANGKQYTLGFARGAEINLSKLQLDFPVLESMQQALQESDNLPTTAVTWRTDLINNYILPKQQEAFVNFMRYFQALSFSKKFLYTFGMLTTSQTLYKFILQDIDHRFNDVCKFRYSLDVAYILGGNTLEHFRFLPFTYKFSHDFISFIFDFLDSKYRMSQAVEKLLDISLPYFYISALDRILFTPLTRSQAAWMESADFGDGVPRSWSPYLVIVLALIMAHSIAFGLVKNLSSANFDNMLFSRDRLLQMTGLIFTAKMQNLMQDKYDEQFTMQDSKELYTLLLLAGGCAVIFFEMLWTFYGAPGIKFLLDYKDKYYPNTNESNSPDELEIKAAQNEIAQNMLEAVENKKSLQIKEGLFFWSKRSPEQEPATQNSEKQDDVPIVTTDPLVNTHSEQRALSLAI